MALQEHADGRNQARPQAGGLPAADPRRVLVAEDEALIRLEPGDVFDATWGIAVP